MAGLNPSCIGSTALPGSYLTTGRGAECTAGFRGWPCASRQRMAAPFTQAALVIGRAALAARPLVMDSLTAAAAQRGLVIQRNASGSAAPGVRQCGVAAYAALPVQARGDDDNLVGLSELFHLTKPLGDSLRLASHHPAVVGPAGAELRRAGELVYLLRPQRLTDPA